MSMIAMQIATQGMVQGSAGDGLILPMILIGAGAAILAAAFRLMDGDWAQERRQHRTRR